MPWDVGGRHPLTLDVLFVELVVVAQPDIGRGADGVVADTRCIGALECTTWSTGHVVAEVGRLVEGTGVGVLEEEPAVFLGTNV